MPTELEAGYRVAVDKDGVAARLPAPTLPLVQRMQSGDYAAGPLPS